MTVHVDFLGNPVVVGTFYMVAYAGNGVATGSFATVKSYTDKSIVLVYCDSEERRVRMNDRDHGDPCQNKMLLIPVEGNAGLMQRYIATSGAPARQTYQDTPRR